MNHPTAERVRELLHYNPKTGIFVWRISTSNRVRPGSVAGSASKYGRVYIAIDGLRCEASHLAWLHTHGVWPEGLLDHANRDCSDDRIKNLRHASHSQNGANAGIRSTNTSGVKGVSWDAQKNRWYAKITHDGRQISLGRYSDLGQARAAYAKAAGELFGDFAHTEGSA